MFFISPVVGKVLGRRACWLFHPPWLMEFVLFSLLPKSLPVLKFAPSISKALSGSSVNHLVYAWKRMRAKVKAINYLFHLKKSRMQLSGLLLSPSRRWSVVELANASATNAFTLGRHSWFFLICRVAPVNLSVLGAIPYSRGDCFEYFNNSEGNVSRFFLVISAGITLCPYHRLMGRTASPLSVVNQKPL